MVVAARSGDAGEEVPAHPLAQPTGAARAQDPPPVPAQRRLDRGVGEDGERPLDRVDLGHHGGVDHPGRLEEALVVPVGVVAGQVVADRVVLPREEVVQQRQAQPPVAVDARQVDPGVALEGQPAVGLQPQPAVAGKGPQQMLPLGRAAVELGAVPPVRLGVGEHRRAARSGPPRRRRGAHDLHGVARRGPVVAGGKGHLDALVAHALPVAHPVVDHELQPGGGQQVQDRRLLDPPVAGQERLAHLARVGVEQVARGRPAPERLVPAERRAGRARGGPAGVGERAVGRALPARRRDGAGHRAARGLAALRGHRRLVEVERAQPGADGEQAHQPEQPGLLVPRPPALEAVAHPQQHPPEHPLDARAHGREPIRTIPRPSRARLVDIRRERRDP